MNFKEMKNAFNEMINDSKIDNKEVIVMYWQPLWAVFFIILADKKTDKR